MTIINAFLDDTIADERWFLDQLSTQAKVVVDSERLGRALFMTWDQIGQIADSAAGLSIGSHSHTHRKLARLDDATQLVELTHSKQILEDRLRRPIEALAYPYGWPGACSAVTRKMAAAAGYNLAFSSKEGVNIHGKFDRYDLGRIGVGAADSAALIRARAALYGAFARSFL
jgi:peptidoglycan/xylan/chitin deacetylase (PgdA/CDA1 family)